MLHLSLKLESKTEPEHSKEPTSRAEYQRRLEEFYTACFRTIAEDAALFVTQASLPIPTAKDKFLLALLNN